MAGAVLEAIDANDNGTIELDEWATLCDFTNVRARHTRLEATADAPACGVDATANHRAACTLRPCACWRAADADAASGHVPYAHSSPSTR